MITYFFFKRSGNFIDNNINAIQYPKTKPSASLPILKNCSKMASITNTIPRKVRIIADIFSFDIRTPMLVSLFIHRNLEEQIDQYNHNHILHKDYFPESKFHMKKECHK